MTGYDCNLVYSLHIAKEIASGVFGAYRVNDDVENGAGCAQTVHLSGFRHRGGVLARSFPNPVGFRLSSGGLGI